MTIENEKKKCNKHQHHQFHIEYRPFFIISTSILHLCPFAGECIIQKAKMVLPIHTIHTSSA